MAKTPPAPKGAPEWMVTYGDLMSLLLCFFVLLFSMSYLEEAKMSEAVESLNDAFGYKGDGMAANVDVIRQRIDKLHKGRFIDVEKRKPPPEDEEPIEGEETPHGEESLIQHVPRFDMGESHGFLIPFGFGNDELNFKAKMNLKQISNGLVGAPFKIVIKGHASQGELSGSYRTDLDLAYTRAVNVRNYLVSQGMKEKLFQILVVGQNEPIDRTLLPKGTDPKAADSAVMILMSSTPAGR